MFEQVKASLDRCGSAHGTAYMPISIYGHFYDMATLSVANRGVETDDSVDEG